MVMLEYEYGTDIDEAYDDLKKQIDIISTQLPDDAEEPVIMEMSMDAQADITLSINNSQSPILKIAVSLHMIQRGSDQIEHFSPI